jgi:hypothetical protein
MVNLPKPKGVVMIIRERDRCPDLTLIRFRRRAAPPSRPQPLLALPARE